jgi:hypothetical protein
MPNPVAAQTNARECSHLIAGITGFYSGGDMDVLSPVFIVCCVDTAFETCRSLIKEVLACLIV